MVSAPADATSDVLPLPCGPAPDGYDSPFWEGLAAGRLVLPRCGSCRAWRPPGHPICPGCWSFDVRWQEVRPVGSVFSWIRSHRDFMEELDVRAPYDTVLVALDDAPIRLLGLLVDGTGEPPAIGDRVTGTIEHPVNAAWPILRWTCAVSPEGRA